MCSSQLLILVGRLVACSCNFYNNTCILQNLRYTVEVADFDFGPVEEALHVRFYDRLRDAISSATLRGPRGPRLVPDNNSVVTRYGSMAVRT